MSTAHRKRFIALAGNIGAGKTELVGFLGRRYGVKPVFEPNDANPYLADFYRDMKSWSFHSQVWFLAHKVRLHLAIQDEPGTVIQDRTIYEDAEIFAESLHRRGLMSDRDHATYRELYEVSAATLAPPDLLVYLRARVPTLRKRIARRGRESERDLPPTYLSSLNKLYDEWIAGYDKSPVLTLETDDVDWLTDLVDRIDVLSKIERYL